MTAESRFFQKVDQNGPLHPVLRTRCWMWLAGKDGKGYGAFWTGSIKGKAHRFSYELAYGIVPAEMCVLHRCDNPSCVNPEHLFVGTLDDNSKDMVQKGRQATGVRCGVYTHPESRATGERNGQHTHPERTARGINNGKYTHPEKTPVGEEHGMARLTNADVLEIRARYRRGCSINGYRGLARAFGVCPSTIVHIMKNRTWVSSGAGYSLG